MTSIADIFDSVCFNFGDNDAIIGPNSMAVGYTEIQQSSLFLAYQLIHRFRPSYVLLDLRSSVTAEAVSILACIRIGIPFVPVSAEELHVGDRLGSIVTCLRGKSEATSSSSSDASRTQIVGIVRCDDDRDPILTKFSAVNVHNVIYVNGNGDVLEPMDVPCSFPSLTEIPDDLYVLFTSGTSGNKPKAVVGSHSSTIRRLQWFADKFPFSNCDDNNNDTIVARRSKLTFVDGITELLSGLLFPPGVLYALDTESMATRGIATILSTPCTRLTLLPSQLSQLLLLLSTAEGGSIPKSAIQTVIVSGEPCPPSIVTQFRDHFPNGRLINLYGQTESTGDVLCADLTSLKQPIKDNVCAVGWPIPGVSVSLGVDNELIVTGNLSNGYLHSEPFKDFHTGDVGFSTPDGCWYVKGRVDDICKINGVLTSPSEVEAAFAKVYEVPCCAVIIDGIVYVLAEYLDDKDITFSREAMNRAGIPWNLIPKLAFFRKSSIPRSSSGGAGKIDRKGVQTIIQAMIDNQSLPDKDFCQDDLAHTVAEVLGIPVVDETSSFVELGGDSALAITLLYKMRNFSKSFGSRLTAADILEADSITEIRSLVATEAGNKRKRKRHENQEVSSFTFRKDVESITKVHTAVAFKACVDASPLVVDDVGVFGACQGGVIQRISCDKNVSVSASYELNGWSIQGDLILHGDDTIVACGYHQTEEAGLVVGLTLDLASVQWTKRLEGKIKSTPVTLNGLVYVLAGSTLHAINPTETEKESKFIALPSESQSKPVIISTGEGGSQLVYAFSDWDTGLAVIENLDGSKEMELTIIQGITSPVYADLLTTGHKRVIVADISGYIYDVSIDDLKITKCTKVSNKPIFSAPMMLSDDSMVLGCHDGIVRCIDVNNMDVTRWQYSSGAVVYVNTLPIANDSNTHELGFVVVCTTAGDVLVLDPSNDGKEKSRHSVDGEIWSNPVNLTTSSGTTRIIVGARDSKVHLITIAES